MDLVINRKSPAKCEASQFFAPLTDERCNYNAMIEYVTIRKLKG
jgi:hypothetical protein